MPAAAEGSKLHTDLSLCTENQDRHLNCVLVEFAPTDLLVALQSHDKLMAKAEARGLSL